MNGNHGRRVGRRGAQVGNDTCAQRGCGGGGSTVEALVSSVRARSRATFFVVFFNRRVIDLIGTQLGFSVIIEKFERLNRIVPSFRIIDDSRTACTRRLLRIDDKPFYNIE